ncbi:TPA: hypothetical protein EYP66_04325 [Candidatus Poribacteria bacterium]|nr:hypothetical protein [Candidatus Poribacteria bacterium]
MRFLYQTVKEVLASGRIGSPVFVRCLAQIASDRVHLQDALAEVLATASAWLGAHPQQVYAQGGEDAGHITAAVHYVSGQTALVSMSATKTDGPPRVDLMLLGNKGAIYHDSLLLPLFAMPTTRLISQSEQLSSTKALMDAVERSLQTGKSAIIEGGKSDE